MAGVRMAEQRGRSRRVIPISSLWPNVGLAYYTNRFTLEEFLPRVKLFGANRAFQNGARYFRHNKHWNQAFQAFFCAPPVYRFRIRIGIQEPVAAVIAEVRASLKRRRRHDDYGMNAMQAERGIGAARHGAN